MKKIDLNKDDPLLVNHNVLNKGIFPAVGYFEIILTSLYEEVWSEIETFPLEINSAFWFHPLDSQGHQEICVTLEKQEGGYTYRVETEQHGIWKLHGSGTVSSEKKEKTQLGKKFKIKKFAKKCSSIRNKSAIYRDFKKKGIHYKKLFKSLEFFQSSGKETLGKVKCTFIDNYRLNLGFLDAAIQCALLNIDEFQNAPSLLVPFSLQKIIIWKPLGPSGYVKTTLIEAHNEGHAFRFDILLTDEEGNILAEMKDLCVKAFQPEERDQWAIAATFTAAPLQKPLTFWNEQLNWNNDIHFAPYNQVFQALLDPQSLLYQNRSGANVLLFRLEDLQSYPPKSDPKASDKQKEKSFGDAKRFVLPNGLEISHLNPYETQYLYEEIFVERTYLKCGIKLSQGATVIDVGANIGMFSLFIAEQCPSAKIFAFEPSPVTFKVLNQNMTVYSPQATVCNVGIADSNRDAEFTFYPHSSVFSGFHTDIEKDRDALRQAIENEVFARGLVKEGENVDAYVDAMVQDRLHKESYRCQLRSLPSLFEEYDIANVDLLKIDAEKCEWEILTSLQEKDWKKIRQIVVEVHDKQGTLLKEVKSLLSNKGFNIDVIEEDYLAESGLFNIYGKRDEKNKVHYFTAKEQGIENNLSELLTLLNRANGELKVPLLLSLCPPSPKSQTVLSDSFLQQMEQRIEHEARQWTNISMIRSTEFGQLYTQVDYYDAIRDEMGHIPYTSHFFAAMATSLVRRLYALKRPAYKVIALDCDNTLWSGIVGEQGAMEVQVGAAFQELQQFMLEQKKKGMLICLVSKNDESDVKAVFETREGMILKWKDLAGWKINWTPKSKNLSDLAKELNLGLESFIFLDDSPVECAEVAANCPQVLTLQLPMDVAAIPTFLKHTWAFDQVYPVTEEDAQRTKQYQQNKQREDFRKSATTFKDFIANLQLDVKILPAQEHDAPRIAQLTQRTNQFNARKQNLNVLEVEHMLKEKQYQCHVVQVTDRFGDYGTCGIIIFTEKKKKLKLHTFLLSCRALGRGVEHKMLAFLGKKAFGQNIKMVELLFIASPKNQPVKTFLQTIGSLYLVEKKGQSLYQFPTTFLKKLTFQPLEKASYEIPQKTTNPASDIGQSDRLNNHSALMQRIANEQSCLRSLLDEKEREKPLPTPSKEMVSGDLYEHVQNVILENLGKILDIDPSCFGVTEAFSEFGLDSMGTVDLTVKLNEALQIVLPTTTLYDYSCVADLSQHIHSEYKEPLQQWMSNTKKPVETPFPSPLRQNTEEQVPPQQREGVAVIGLSGRFPGASHVEAFWELLSEGRSSIREIPPERWDIAAHYDPDREKPNKTYSKWGGFLDDIDKFDALFFNISGREAEQIDPQQRLFLEECWHALENAGYARESQNKEWGVFVGTDAGDYQSLLQIGDIPKEAASFMGNHASILAARIAYFMNLKGAALAIDTACSSSLVAVHMACESLLKGEVNLALAGGVAVRATANFHILSSKAGMLAGDGKCKVFDDQADGFVPGEAVGVVILKRLEAALNDNDQIYGVIKGSGINQDGKTNGITAPSGLAQTELILKVYQNHGIDPKDIGYVEAHGTGTKLGDPIEVRALTHAFRQYTEKTQFCAIGSSKSNIGHGTHAAGISALIKLILCLHHKKWVPSLNFNRPNQHIQFEESPFFVNTQFRDWPVEPGKRRLGAVSSFGFSGTNAHMVVEQAPDELSKAVTPKPYYLVPLSAKTQRSLQQFSLNLAEWLEQHGEAQNLADICYTLCVGRSHFDERWTLVVRSNSELKENLEQIAQGETPQNWLQGQGNTTTKADEVVYKQVLKQVANDLQSIDPDTQVSEYHELLMTLGGLFVKGHVSHLAHLFTGQSGLKRLGLPLYVFSDERYWVSEKKEEPNQIEKVPSEVLGFEEVWKEQALGKSIPVQNLVCILSNGTTQQAFSNTIQSLNPKTDIFFIAPAQAPNTYRDAFREIQEKVESIEVVLYLQSFAAPNGIHDITQVTALFQAIGTHKIPLKRFVMAATFADGLERCYQDSWIAFGHSLKQSFLHTQFVTVLQEAQEIASGKGPGVWGQRLWKESTQEKIGSVLYQNGKRYKLQVQPSPLTLKKSLYETALPLSKKTVVITGGCGGLGFLFAQHFAKTRKANLILTGRSPLTPEKQSRLQKLEALGSAIFYLQADVCDQQAMQQGLTIAKERFGKISGVLHAAGIEGSKSLLDKPLQEFENVLAPKVQGTLVLDEILKQEPLDFICYFSSSSAILGDFGSCDYAMANRFQMVYAHHRNELQAQGERFGKAFVINWPVWREGGMGKGNVVQMQFYLKSSGQRFLETQEGFHLFESLLDQKKPQHLVLVGDPQRIYRFLDVPQTTLTGESLTTPTMLEQQVTSDLQRLMSQLLKVPEDRLEKHRNLTDFGFDSINLAEFATILSRYYDLEISPTLFFAHSTPQKLIDYFVSEQTDSIRRFYSTKSLPISDSTASAPMMESTGVIESPRTTTPARVAEMDIAIIGMSGRFPQANTVEELWHNIKNAKNCITEIPKDRWDWREYNEASQKVSQKSHSKWGAFIEGIDQFDASFFDIPPGEAIQMDPRQRLFLEEAWHAFEDAGYMGKRIRGSACGVYVGVEEGDYGFFSEESSINSNHNATLAARIAYFLDLRGPNLALTAACSSGLVALHQACLALQQGDCEMALVGGVNLLTSPKDYLGLSRIDMLSSDGKCRVFDQQANGTVPGEAIAVVLLKSLTKAISDKDTIYGSIKASGVNYDGKTNGITAPTPLSQVDLLKTTYQKYNINPANIQYVMAHSIGSKIGDPIEIEALTQVFRNSTEKKQFCSIGSVKPLIGHTFASSGVVHLIIMLMAMKNRIIPGTPSSDNQNPYIDFQDSPFVFNRDNRRWKTDNTPSQLGTISSTGISGTNAHIVVAAFQQETMVPDQPNQPEVFPLSAQNNASLRDYAEKLIEFIKKKEGLSLSSLAYSLQTGREPMEVRIAFIAETLSELLQKLYRWVDDSSCETHSPSHPTWKFSQSTLDFDNLDQLAKCWSEGATIDWERLYQNRSIPPRINLPTYCFQRKSYWIHSKQTANIEIVPPNFLEPLEKPSLKQQIKSIFCELFAPGEEIDETKPFFELGLTSINAVQFVTRLESQLHVVFEASDIFSHPTLQELADYLAPQFSEDVQPTAVEGSNLESILLNIEKDNIDIEEALVLLDHVR